PPSDKERDTTSKGILAYFDNVLVDVRNIKLNNSEVNLVRHTPDKPGIKKLELGERTIDWKDLHVKNLNLDISDIRYNLRNRSVSANVNGITLEESRGLRIEDLKFKAALDAAGIHLEKFRYLDNFSDIKLDYANALFEDFSDFSDFLHKVSLDCSLDDAKVSLASLGLYLPALDYLTLTLKANGKVKGPVANMKISSFTVDGPGTSHVELSGQLNGLPLSDLTIMSANISKCHFTTTDLEQIISSVAQQPLKKGTLSKFAPGTTFNFTGFMDGFFTDFVAYGGLSSNIGRVDVDLLCQSTPNVGFSMDGFMDASNFHLGKFLQNDKMGELSCSADLSGFASPAKDQSYFRMDSLYVSKFNFNEYDYKGITASGKLDSEGLEILARDDDPNLDFDLKADISNAKDGQRTYDVDMDLRKANLVALNLDKQEVSIVGMKLNGSVLQTGKDTFEGDIFINDLDCINATGLHDLGNIRLNASLLPSNQNLTLSSSFLNARLTGTTSISDIVKDAKYALLHNKLDNLLKAPKDALKYSGGQFGIDLRVADIRQLLAFVMPDLHIENGTSLSFQTDSTGSSTFTLKSDLLSFKDIYSRDLLLTFDSIDSTAFASIDADLIRIGSLVAYNNHLGAGIEDNQVKLDISYDNTGNEQSSKGNLKATVAFPDSSAAYKVLVALDKSGFVVDGKEWQIDPSSILIDKGRFNIRDFALESSGQYMKVNGVISDNPEEECTVDLNNFDMSLANIFLKEPLSLAGRLTGNARASALLGDYEMSADLGDAGIAFAIDQIA
ncbi:MAG: hypothetical protein IIU49_05035, partial [Spirochaetales bacterium]|nr:hypothetical protein [Spirochaetales bacterium]